MRLAFGIMAAALMAGTGWADDEPVKPPVQEEAKPEAAPPAASGDLPLEAHWKNGLHIRTKDKMFDVHVGGRVLEEYRTIFDRPVGPNQRTSADAFYLREFFVGIDGTIAKNWGFKLNGDFAPSAAELEEGYIEWRALKEFRVRAGQFKQPLSLETMSSPRFIECIRRSDINRFVPSLEPGLMVNGKLAGGVFGYQAAVSNGRGHLENGGRSQSDDNDSKEYHLRLTLTPWKGDEESPLHHLQLGVYGSMTRVGGHGTSPAGWGPNTGIKSVGLGARYLDFGPGPFRFMGDRTRLGAEVVWADGPFGLAGEYMARKDEFENTATGVDGDLPINAWYAQAAWLITGEKMEPFERVVPLSEFSLSEGTWGAFEAVLRVGGVTLGEDELGDMGVSLVGQSHQVTVLTAGINWWPVQNVRFAANVVREDYHDDVAFSDSRMEDALTAFLMRFQVDF